jgi:hypothetical protein
VLIPVLIVIVLVLVVVGACLIGRCYRRRKHRHASMPTTTGQAPRQLEFVGRGSTTNPMFASSSTEFRGSSATLRPNPHSPKSVATLRKPTTKRSAGHASEDHDQYLQVPEAPLAPPQLPDEDAEAAYESAPPRILVLDTSNGYETPITLNPEYATKSPAGAASNAVSVPSVVVAATTDTDGDDVYDVSYTPDTAGLGGNAPLPDAPSVVAVSADTDGDDVYDVSYTPDTADLGGNAPLPDAPPAPPASSNGDTSAPPIAARGNIPRYVNVADEGPATYVSVTDEYPSSFVTATEKLPYENVGVGGISLGAPAFAPRPTRHKGTRTESSSPTKPKKRRPPPILLSEAEADRPSIPPKARRIKKSALAGGAATAAASDRCTHVKSGRGRCKKMSVATSAYCERHCCPTCRKSKESTEVSCAMCTVSPPS